jgi:endonuclease/exonuclease/phosphatase family metal-dependent hydrolase
MVKLYHGLKRFNRSSEYTATSKEHTFFSAAHWTFSTIDHILEHKASLNNYKIIEKHSCVSSDHNEIKLEINSKTSYKNIWALINILINDQSVIENTFTEI